MREIYLISIWLLLTTINTFSQSDSLKIDSLKKVLQTQKEDSNKVNTLNELSELLVEDRSASMKYAKDALILSKEINFKNGEGIADYNYAVALAGSSYVGERGSFDELLKYYNSAINILKKNNNNAKLADCYYNIAEGYWSFKQDQAEYLKNILIALRINESINRKQAIARCLQSLAKIYVDTGNDSLAVKYTIQALKTFRENHDSNGIADMSNALGIIYIEKGNDSAGLAQFFYALKIYQLLGKRGVDYRMPFTYGNIGQSYNGQGETFLSNDDKANAYKEILSSSKIL